MRLLYLSKKESTVLAQAQMMAELAELLPKYFPGSIIYGPGYSNYVTNDVLEILELYGGEHSFDAVFCVLPERELSGHPISFESILRYKIPSNLWIFPKNLEKVRLPKIFGLTDFWHLSIHDWDAIIGKNGFSMYLNTLIPPFLSFDVFRLYFSREVLEKVICLPIGTFTSESLFSHECQKNMMYCWQVLSILYFTLCDRR